MPSADWPTLGLESQYGGLSISTGRAQAPLELDQARDVPVVVDKDVALVEVGQGHDQGAAPEAAAGKLGKQGAHHSEGGDLVLAVALVVNRVWLQAHALVVASEHVG
jgi:hypothetical protein